MADRIDINTCSVDELARVPGVGPKRAREIVEMRDRKGELRSLDDVREMKGFDRRLGQVLKERTTLGKR